PRGEGPRPRAGGGPSWPAAAARRPVAQPALPAEPEAGQRTQRHPGRPGDQVAVGQPRPQRPIVVEGVGAVVGDERWRGGAGPPAEGLVCLVQVHLGALLGRGDGGHHASQAAADYRDVCHAKASLVVCEDRSGLPARRGGDTTRPDGAAASRPPQPRPSCWRATPTTVAVASRWNRTRPSCLATDTSRPKGVPADSSPKATASAVQARTPPGPRRPSSHSATAPTRTVPRVAPTTRPSVRETSSVPPGSTTTSSSASPSCCTTTQASALTSVAAAAATSPARHGRAAEGAWDRGRAPDVMLM